FGQNLELIHAAQASAEALAADEQTQHDTVVFNVQQAYFALLAAYRLRDVAEETVAQNQKHLDLAPGRHGVGLAPRIDITTAQVQLAQAELNQLTPANNFSLGRETLRNTLGLAGPLDFDIVDSLEQARTEVSDEEALDLAYANRPELRSLAAQERADIERIKAIEKDYLPKLTVVSNVIWTGSSYPLQETWNFGGLVNLSVFNGGLTTAQVGEAKANLENLRATEEATRQNVTLEVQTALLNLRQQAESIVVADKGLQQARENLSLAEGRYKTGVGNIIELTDAQVALAGAPATRDRLAPRRQHHHGRRPRADRADGQCDRHREPGQHRAGGDLRLGPDPGDRRQLQLARQEGPAGRQDRPGALCREGARGRGQRGERAGEGAEGPG